MNRLFALLLFGVFNCSVFYGEYTLPVSGYKQNSVTYRDRDSDKIAKKNYKEATPSENLDSLLTRSFKYFYLSVQSFRTHEYIRITLDIDKKGGISNLIIVDSTNLNKFEKGKIKEVFTGMKQWKPAKKLFSKKSTVLVKFGVKIYRTVLDDYFADGCKKIKVVAPIRHKFQSTVHLTIPLIQDKEGKLSIHSDFPNSKDVSMSEVSRTTLDSLIKFAPKTNSLPQNQRAINLRTAFKIEKKKNNDVSTGAPNDNIYFADDLTSTPQFIGNLQDYLSKNLIGLRTPRRNKLSGKPFKLMVFFIVEKDGYVSDVTIPKRYSTSLNDNTRSTIIETIEQTQWSPGIKLDEPVRVRIALPITIAP